MPVKTIRFDYYQVVCRNIDKIREVVSYPLFDLEPILEQARELTAVDRTYNYYDEESRLQDVYIQELDQLKLWSLQFLRIRKNIIPGIATDDGAYEPLPLGEGENIGEEVTALYDPEYCILMLQRNRNSLSPIGIQAYLNSAWPEHLVELRPIILPEGYMHFKETDFYRGITVSMADIRASEIKGRSSLFGLLQAVEKFSGINAEIKISLGNKGKKDQSLSQQEILDTINEFKSRPDVTKLEVRKKESEDSKVELFDLIEHRLHDLSSFKYSRDNTIEHCTVFERMVNLYKETKQTFGDILRKRE